METRGANFLTKPSEPEHWQTPSNRNQWRLLCERLICSTVDTLIGSSRGGCVTSQCVAVLDGPSGSSQNTKHHRFHQSVARHRLGERDEKIKAHSTENRFLMDPTHTHTHTHTHTQKCVQSDQLWDSPSWAAGTNSTGKSSHVLTARNATDSTEEHLTCPPFDPATCQRTFWKFTLCTLQKTMSILRGK